MALATRNWKRSCIVLAAGTMLLGSCATTQSPQSRMQFVPTLSRPAPAPVLLEPPPPLLTTHLPARDPALALVYQNPADTDRFGSHREADRSGRRNSPTLLEKFQAQEVESWKKTPDIVSQQSEPLLLEEVLRLNIREGPGVPADLRRILLATKSELPLTLNEQVTRYINYFLGKGRTTLRESLRRAGAYRPMISRILAEHGVPQEMIYLVQAESGFRPTVRSSKRATGMWQFVAWRGREYGLNQNRQVDERLDPEKATYAAARHLADLYAQFGNWYLAMAAYNCGPGGVQRAIERTGHADYWEFVRRAVLPRETANYVPVILAMTLLAKNAEAFELDDVVPESPIHYDTVVTNSRIGLGLIADATGSTVSRIKQLNPALLGHATPDAPYSLRIPNDTAERFQQEIAAVPEARRLSWRRHEVRSGETLAQIAAAYRVRMQEIAVANQLGRTGSPAPGDRLTIPVATRPEPVLRRVGHDPALPTSHGLASRYQVRSGDTLAAIAKRYGVTIAQLQHWNRLTHTRLKVGQVLTVREPSLAAGLRSQVASNSRVTRVRSASVN